MPYNLAQLTIASGLNLKPFSQTKQGSYGIVRKAMSMDNEETYVSCCLLCSHYFVKSE